MKMWWSTGDTRDPVVVVGDESYRVTPVSSGRYLVTRKSDANRIGTIEGSSPSDVEESVRALLAQVAVQASRAGLLR